MWIPYVSILIEFYKMCHSSCWIGRALWRIISEAKTSEEVFKLTRNLYKLKLRVLYLTTLLWFGTFKILLCMNILWVCTQYVQYAPKWAIVEDMCWEPCEAWWKICIAQLWNLLLDMEDKWLLVKRSSWGISKKWKAQQLYI